MEQTFRIGHATIQSRKSAQPRQVRIINLEGEPLQSQSIFGQDREYASNREPAAQRIFGQDREYATQREFAAQVQQRELLRSFRLNPWG